MSVFFKLERIEQTLNEIKDTIADLDVGIPVVGRLTPNGNSVCLILPKTILDAAKWRVGDMVYARMLKVDLEKTSTKAALGVKAEDYVMLEEEKP